MIAEHVGATSQRSWSH